MIEFAVQALDILHFSKLRIVRESSVSHELAKVVAHLLLHKFLIVGHVIGNWLASENVAVFGAVASSSVFVKIVLDTSWPRELHWVDWADVRVGYFLKFFS